MFYIVNLLVLKLFHGNSWNKGSFELTKQFQLTKQTLQTKPEGTS